MPRHNESPLNSSPPVTQTSFFQAPGLDPEPPCRHSEGLRSGSSVHRSLVQEGPHRESGGRAPERGQRRWPRSSDHSKVTTEPAAVRVPLSARRPSLHSEPRPQCPSALRGESPHCVTAVAKASTAELGASSPSALGQDPEASPGTVPSSFFALSTQLFPTPGRTGKRRRRRAGRRRINSVAGPAH